jgi:hypothetical protein
MCCHFGSVWTSYHGEMKNVLNLKCTIATGKAITWITNETALLFVLVVYL